jgi:hypothetical protein
MDDISIVTLIKLLKTPAAPLFLNDECDDPPSTYGEIQPWRPLTRSKTRRIGGRPDAAGSAARRAALWLRGWLLADLAIGCCGTPSANAEDYRRLSGAEIRRLITGKAVSDEVHYTDRFKAGGVYEGVFMNKRLTGTWKVKGDRICVTRGAEPETCDEIWRSGSKLERRRSGLPNWRDTVTIRPN